MAKWHFSQHRRKIMGEAEPLIDSFIEAYPDVAPLRHDLTKLFRIIGDIAGNVGYDAALKEASAATEPNLYFPLNTANVGMVG